MALSKRCLLEFIGTFFLMLVIAMAAVGGMAGELAPLAVAGILVAMISMAGPFTGAHFNPVVTMGFLLRGGFPPRDAGPYVIVQFLGAFLAVLVQSMLLESPGAQEAATAVLPPDEGGGFFTTWTQIAVAECLFTFALVLVILSVAGAPGRAGRDPSGLAVGMMVMAGMFAVGPVSSAVFNPAVLLGLLAMGAVGLPKAAVILIANIAGGLLATFVFRMSRAPGDQALSSSTNSWRR